jgi:outer membrane protein assembly factor BamB
MRSCPQSIAPRRGSTSRPGLGALLAALALSVIAVSQASAELVYGTEGNRLRRYDVDTIGTDRLVEEVLIDRASAGEFGSPSGPGRDVNGQICRFPDGTGRFLAGEDTGQPTPRAGWGIFAADGSQVGKLTATYQVAGAEPFGCAFDPSSGVLFTSSVGEQGFGSASGQLIMWFPPFAGFPGGPGEYPDLDPTSDNFCKLAVDLGTAGSVLVDPSGRVLVAASGGLSVHRFNPPFPTGPDAAGGCGAVDPQGSPMVDASITERPESETPYREDGLLEGGANMLTPAGLAISSAGTLYASSVFTGVINEYDLETGALLRPIVERPGPFALPTPFGSPQGIAVAADGTLYYADLDLRGTISDPGTIGPGPNGKVWRVRFDESGDPLTPEIVREGLSFPDGVAVFPGDLEQAEWLTFAGGPERRFDNRNESIIGAQNIGDLAIRWQIPAGRIITGSPSVAAVDLPGEGLTQVVFFQSWDLSIYAARLSDGSVLWRFETEDQPGSAFPSTGSVHVAKLAGRDRVFVGQGHNFYSLDAATGEEVWRFTAGTGCGYDTGTEPGLCGFSGERNQIESSAYVADGKVFFGMDVNDVATGKGGFFALDALDGRLVWFFDLESGSTCRPDAGDDVRRYDPYHSELELGLPAGFFATRSGCDHPRTRNGCGNVWSSPAVDLERGAIFVASSNCDTALDPQTATPLPMPPFDEAIFSLDYDGEVRWVWRPREYDNDDLAFGGVPNLFEITVDVEGTLTVVDVVGIGSKDGTYYVLDRDGSNQSNGASWSEDPSSHLPADLPYWRTRVVDGGDVGGILATAAVDQKNRRIHFSTAPGEGSVNSPPNPPQLPTVHALDMDDGSVLWQNVGDTPELASFSSVSVIPGVAVAGTSVGAILRPYFAPTGLPLPTFDLENFGIGSTPIFVDGTLLVGAGIGTRTRSGTGISDIVSRRPSNLTALCVPGTRGCGACDDGVDNDLDGEIDMADDGCIAEGDDSEIRGDIDGDGAVGDRDRRRFFAAFGRAPGQVGYALAADLDPPGAPDGLIGLIDYQRWLAAEAEFNAPPPPACGLLGIEPFAVLAWVRAARRRSRRRCSRGRLRALLLGALAVGSLALGSDAQALATVRLVLPEDAVIVDGAVRVQAGESLSVRVMADLEQPIIGWGLDVETDPLLLGHDSTLVGDPWIAVSAADGDGLAGLASPPGVSGADVWLADLSYTAMAAGSTQLALAITAGDPTEGFALLEIGAFDAVSFGARIEVLVVPEPSTGLLVAAGLLALGARRR